MKLWQKVAGVTALIVFALTVIYNSNNPVSTVTLQSASRLKSSQRQRELRTQFFDNCRQINANSSINVRQNPSNQSPVTERLANGSHVLIVDRSTHGWVLIYQPVRGYLLAKHLIHCGVANPPSNCRSVNGMLGANIREKPSLNSPVLRILNYGDVTNIVNRGSKGWVKISAPINGYIAASSLGYCLTEY
jgi:uncharacterized protein YgiM (DUF1202 family)